MPSPVSFATAAAVVAVCRKTFTATSSPRQRPLYTRAEEPAPSNTPNTMLSSSSQQLPECLTLLLVRTTVQLAESRSELMMFEPELWGPDDFVSLRLQVVACFNATAKESH